VSTLTVADRCDRCGARATVRVELTNGELFFCDHHARQHGFIDASPRTTAAASGIAGE